MNVNHQLLDTLNNLGQQGKPVQRLYARMLDEELFIASYVKLYANNGAMTIGSDTSSNSKYDLNQAQVQVGQT